MTNGRTLEQAERQLALLAEENRRLAGELEGVQKQSQVLERTVRDAREAQASAEGRAAGSERKLQATAKQIETLTEANKRLSAQVDRLTKQVGKQPLNPLSVEEAANLFNRLISGFDALKMLEVRNASLTLKLATAKLGETPVLLLPDPKAVDPATLHELKLDLTASRLPEAAVEIQRADEPPPVKERRSARRTTSRTRR